MAILTVGNLFFQKVLSYGIRYVILKYKNYGKNRWQIRKVLKKTKEKRRLKILGFLVETQITFNGCRTKKKKRK